MFGTRQPRCHPCLSRRILAAIDDADRALKELDSAIVAEPAVRAVALNNITLVYLMDKLFTKAEDCLQRALTLVDERHCFASRRWFRTMPSCYAKLAAREVAAARLRAPEPSSQRRGKTDHRLSTPAKFDSFGR
jgi:hypothetical protein